MLKKIIDFLIIALLVGFLFIQIKAVSFLYYIKFQAKEKTTSDIYRENLNQLIDKKELQYFKQSPLYGYFLKSNSKDSIFHLFNSMDSTYKAGVK